MSNPRGPSPRLRGGAALERGAYTISDENKEKAEFSFGKNFL